MDTIVKTWRSAKRWAAALEVKGVRFQEKPMRSKELCHALFVQTVFF
jgi:hypothetical protein